MTGDEWKNPNPVWLQGREVSVESQSWICDVLKRRVGVVQGFFDGTLDKALVAPMREWYYARWQDFIDWKPYSEFGEGLRDGRWVFCEVDFVNAWNDAHAAAVKALKEAAALKVARSFHSLDEWLAADLNGTIKTSTRGGQLDTKLSNEIFFEAVRRRERWPRNCRQCGVSFSHSKRSVKRCDECRAGKTMKAPAVQHVIGSAPVQKLLPGSTQPPAEHSHTRLEETLKCTTAMIEEAMAFDAELRARDVRKSREQEGKQ